MELVACAFDGVCRSVRGAFAGEPPRSRSLRRNLQKQRQVGRKSVAGEVVGDANRVNRQTAPIALIGNRRVAEAVAHHPLAGFQRGAYDIADKLCARGEEKQQFASVARRVFVLVLYQVPYRLRKPGSARLASQEDVYAASFKGFAEPATLRGLAAALSTLERYEPALGHLP